MRQNILLLDITLGLIYSIIIHKQFINIRG